MRAGIARRRPPLTLLLPSLVLALLLLAVVAGGLLSPFDYARSNLIARLEYPGLLGGDPRFPLGTDRLGRDLVARLVEGLRMSVLVSLAGTILGAVVGVTVGFVAAHFRGIVEEATMMLVDVQASLPFILIALTLLAFFGNSLTLFILLMGLYGWETYARLTRGIVLSAVSQPYIAAVRSLGATPWRIYLRHVLPNVLSPLMVQLTLTFPQIILLETSLSFLGLGIQAPLTSLGQILGDGREYLSSAWWIAVWPGLLIFLATLSMSLIGDWLRDHLDPTLKVRVA